MKKNIKKLLAVTLAASLCIPAIPRSMTNAAASSATFGEAEDISVSQIVTKRTNLFNSGWKFFLGNSTSAQNPNFNDADWQSVDLPHDFSISQNFTTSGEAESGFLPGGTGWYRKSFTLPSNLSDKSLVLNFDGVYNNTYVYVNGKQIGEHHYGYTPFSLDISDYVTCDGSTQNVIAVKVVHNTPSSRWYSGSGIYRDVNLIVTDPVHVAVDGTTVTTPDIESGKGSVSTKIEVVNDKNASADVTVRTTVYDSGNQKVSDTVQKTISIAANSVSEAELSTLVADPILWSVDDPTLYYVRTELVSDGKVTDTYDTSFGFRWYKFTSGSGFSLNGKNVKLNGVCMHHDQGALGSAAYYDAMYRQLKIMKDMGANAIRITHNPGDKDFIEICNKLGLLVIEELFDGWVDPKNENSYDFSSYFTKTLGDDSLLGSSSDMTWAEFAARSVVRRDRNDPSIILWSLCNEVQEGTYWNNVGSYAGIAQNMINWIKEEDATRPTTSGDNNRGGDSRLVAVLNTILKNGGVVGFNYANTSSQLQSLASQYGGVILASETSSHVNSRGIYSTQATRANADGKFHLTSYDTSAVGWGITAHKSIYNTYQSDSVAGEFVWTGFDYIGEPTPWNGTGSGSVSYSGAIPNSSYFGIVETSGFPKDSYYLYRSQWNKEENTLHLVTAWDSNNMLTSGGKTPVWVYSNAPKVELYRNGTLIGTTTRQAHTSAAGHTYYTYSSVSNNSSVCTASNGNGSDATYAVFNVAFEKGTISAKAFDENGEEITEFEGNASVSTPDGATKLKVSADKTELVADGSSLAYVTVDVTDANGNLNTKATNTINFTLEGNGSIAGVDNGDQATTDKFQQASVLPDSTSARINAYAGKALVIIKSTKDAGDIKLNITSGGMTAQSIRIQTKAAANTSSDAISSYRMSKHCYILSGSSSIPLPQSVEATFANGTTKNLPVTWNDYDKDALKKSKAIFQVTGSIKNGEEKIPVTMTIHVYSQIVTAQNYSGITAPDTMPTLPTVSMTYSKDGSAFEEFPVTWDTSKLTNTSFSKVGGLVTINGSVTALGETYPVTASIRVASPVYGDSVNIAPDYLDLTQSCKSASDNLLAIVDGIRSDTNGGGSSSSLRWTNWNTRNDTDSPVITLTWATAHLVDQINLYYYTENVSTSQEPTSVKFEYSLDGSDFVEIDHEEAVKIPDVTTGSATDKISNGYSFKLKSTINPIAVRIILGHDTGKFIGLTEVEVMSSSISYTRNRSASLKGITYGTKSITFNQNTSYKITGDSFDSNLLKISNDVNAAVSVIPVSDKQFTLISVSEDGSETKTYTITLTENGSGETETETPATEPETETPATETETETPATETEAETPATETETETPATETETETETPATETETPVTHPPLTERPETEAPETSSNDKNESQTPAAKPETPSTDKPQTPSTPALKKGDTFKVKNIQYKVLNVSKKTVAVVKGTDRKPGKVTKVTIPNTVKDAAGKTTFTVTQIQANAFKNYKNLKSVIIGKNVTSIGKNSFYGCQKLAKVTFKGTSVKTIKSKAFKKTASKVTVSVPKSIRNNKKKAAAFQKKLTKSGISKKLKLK